MLMYWEKLKTFPKGKHLSCVFSFTRFSQCAHLVRTFTRKAGTTMVPNGEIQVNATPVSMFSVSYSLSINLHFCGVC